MNPPPTKQWQLLELALADYDKIVVNPDYKIYMDVWHTWDSPSGICYVCLAGCAMAQTLKIPHTETIRRLTYHIDNGAWVSALGTINDLRCGIYTDSADEIAIYNDLTSHNINPTQWRSDMDRFVQFLKEQDL